MFEAIGGSITPFGRGPSSSQSRLTNTMQGALDIAERMRNNNNNSRSLIGGGNSSGIASVTADNQAGGLAAKSTIPGGLIGPGGFAVAPPAPAATAAPELAPETPSGDLGAMAAAAITPDPYNNAIRTPQQDAVGQIQGNAFMRDRSLYI
tara:strand:+ start:67 stop:516 length:450 start_codon:yes stop_codon:yes gene_type:complete